MRYKLVTEDEFIYCALKNSLVGIKANIFGWESVNSYSLYEAQKIRDGLIKENSSNARLRIEYAY